jgi:hypothetical protein
VVPLPSRLAPGMSGVAGLKQSDKVKEVDVVHMNSDADEAGHDHSNRLLGGVLHIGNRFRRPEQSSGLALQSRQGPPQ